MSLVLDSLEIKNFRAFKHLRIEKLGRVNLIVGKNNVGKSSVLEALWLYARRGDPLLVWNILAERDENGVAQSKAPTTENDRYVAIRHLFNGWRFVDEAPGIIRIGPTGSENKTLFIAVAEPMAASSEHDKPFPHILDLAELDSFFAYNFSLVAGFGQQPVYDYPLAADNPQLRISKSEHKETKCVHISAEGISGAEISDLWDAIALTNVEDDTVSALNIIAPEVRAVNLVGYGGTNGARIPKVRIPGVDIPIPLRSMGEGMSRIFGIVLALVNAKDGLLLIDEVDTGLHYSVLPDVWKLIFEVAHRLNVQVFATSHSWDCIQAFQQAADENKDEEGILVRLENRKEGVGSVIFDEQDLAIVTREQIEVR